MAPRPRLLLAALCAVLLPAAPAAANRAGPPRGFWIPGDLHVHTIYGHDTCITPTTAWDYTKPDRSARRPCPASYTWGFTPLHRLNEALHRGLGYVAITDHNNVINQSDPAVIAWEKAHPAFVSIPGYENSQAGHVQMLGAKSCYGNHGPTTQIVECDSVPQDKSAHGMRELADALRASGGVFQVNHPSDMNWLHTYGHRVVPDTVEVWNIGPWAYQHPLPAANDNDFSLRWYDGFLRRGDEVGATGGSDSHWRLTDPVQGVGDPTTWVYVTQRSIQGVLDGIKAHHTFVSALPPIQDGARLFLEADAGHDGTYEAIAGSQVTPGSAYRVRTMNALPGSVVQIVTDAGTVLKPLPLSGTLNFSPGVDGMPRASQFVRAELLEPGPRLLMEALTSPIFVRAG